MNPVKGALELFEAGADVADPGTARVAVKGGVLTASVDGGAYTQLATTASAGITTLTGDVTAGPGSGSQAATIAASAVTTAKIADANVTLAKQANLAAGTVQGRAFGAGTGVPTALTGAQLAAIDTNGNTTTTTLVAPGTNILVSGLDGANDGDWLVYFYLIGASTTGVPILQFNGVSDANEYCAWTQVSGASTVSGSRSLGSIELGTAVGTAERATGWLVIRAGAADGLNYNRLGMGTIFGPSGPVIRQLGFVIDQPANITTMRINCAANSLAAGSYLSVQRLRRVYT